MIIVVQSHMFCYQEPNAQSLSSNSSITRKCLISCFLAHFTGWSVWEPVDFRHLQIGTLMCPLIATISDLLFELVVYDLKFLWVRH